MKNKSKAVELSDLFREKYPSNNISIAGRKSVYSIGINDADYATQPFINEEQSICPVYRTWLGMLKRTNSKQYQEQRPTYKDIAVCNEWLLFSNFRKWFIENHVDDYQLDKDLLFVGNKIYSPETCIYVPSWLNSFVLARNSSRGKYKIGVCWNEQQGKFVARCSNPITKKQRHVGCYDDEIEAYNAWLARKLEIALELKSEMDAIDLRIYPNVVEIIKSMT